jgi:hypothetical protein
LLSSGTQHAIIHEREVAFFQGNCNTKTDLDVTRTTFGSFMRLYNSLPPEARQSLVEKRLAPLLDIIPKERAKKGASFWCEELH